MNKLKQNCLNEEEVSRAKKRVSYRSAGILNDTFKMFVAADPINVEAIARMDYFIEERIPIEEKLSRIEMVSCLTLRRVAEEYLPQNRENGNYVLLIRDPLKE